MLELAGVALLTAGALAVASRCSSSVPRCPVGAVALDPRCCGEGQSLEGTLCVGAPSRCPDGLEAKETGCVAPASVTYVEGGTVDLSPSDWDAVSDGAAARGEVAAFRMDRFEVTESRYGACVAEGACRPTQLRGEPGLPVTWVDLEDAQRFCAFASGAVPTVLQHALAGAGTEGRRYPWGQTGAVCRRATFGLVEGPCGVGSRGPEVAGMRPDGGTPHDIHDLSGNVAEWATNGGLAFARGGSYRDTAARALRTWSGLPLRPTERRDDVGFRCVYAP